MTENTTSRSSPSSRLSFCQNQARPPFSHRGGVLLSPAQATSNVATAYVPSAAPEEPLHPGDALLLKPCSGVLDTVSRSHLDLSCMTKRLKSRLALVLGLPFFGAPLPPAPRPGGDTGHAEGAGKTWMRVHVGRGFESQNYVGRRGAVTEYRKGGRKHRRTIIARQARARATL